MPAARLSKAVVEAARVQPGEPPLFLWDASLPGFGLRVTVSVRSFVVQRRLGNPAKTVRTTIGRFPHVSVDAARTKANALLASQVTQPTHTVQSLMSSFIPNYVEKRHKPKTRKTELQLIQDHILPHLGQLSLCELTRATITNWHSDKIAAPIAANRALAHLSKACSYAVARDWMQHNPCKGIERNQERTLDRYLTDAELTAIFDIIAKIDGDCYLVCAALVLSGMRCGELFGDFTLDTQRKVIWLNDSKTGAKSIPLNEIAYSIFERGIPYGMGYRRVYDVFKDACLKARVTGVSLHTLRHTLATYMAQHGNSLFEIAAMGGWKSLSMVQRYVTLHGVGTPHPTPAGERIAQAIGLCTQTSGGS